MIKSGATAWHRIKPGVDLNLISEIIITYKNASAYGAKIVMQRRYPSQTIVHGGDILVPLSQADTTMLREQSGGTLKMELQYNYTSGAVTKSQIKTVYIENTLATEYIDGSAPDDAQIDAKAIEFSADVVIVAGDGGGTGGYIIGSGLKLDRNTNTLSVDSTDAAVQGDDRPITSHGVYNEFAVINALLKTI